MIPMTKEADVVNGATGLGTTSTTKNFWNWAYGICKLGYTANPDQSLKCPRAMVVLKNQYTQASLNEMLSSTSATAATRFTYIAYAYSAAVGARDNIVSTSPEKYYPIKLSMIRGKSTSRLLMVTDSRYGDGNVQSYSDQGIYKIMRSSAAAGDFHQGASNLSFMDGHVGSLKSARKMLCSNTSRGGVGNDALEYFLK